MSIYCCSDLHGRYDIWRQIKSFLKPEDKLYYLGDAADRGPNGWKIIKELISDNRIIYIKGNHEDMLVKAMKEYIKYDGGYCNSHNKNHCNEDYDTHSELHSDVFLLEFSCILKALAAFLENSFACLRKGTAENVAFVVSPARGSTVFLGLSISFTRWNELFFFVIILRRIWCDLLPVLHG